MNKVLTIMFLGFSLVIQAQPPTGVMGVPFRSSKAEVLKIMKSKGGVFDAKRSAETALVFDKVDFAGRGDNSVVFAFYKDVFYAFHVFMLPAHKSKILDLYETITGELEEKYGEPTDIVEVYRYPYKKGDEYYATAISGGYADLKKKWIIGPSIRRVNISVEVDPSMLLKIVYQDATMADALQEKLKEKHKEDY